MAASERSRKKADTQVRVKVARYMQSTTPGTLHMVQDIARALGTLPASTSGALAVLAGDPYLYIVKVSYGTYSYRPPGTPNSADPAFSGTSLQPRLPAETPEQEAARAAAGPPRRDPWCAPGRTARGSGTGAPGEVPEGYLRIVHTTSKGVQLAEDHNGDLFKVISIEESL